MAIIGAADQEPLHANWYFLAGIPARIDAQDNTHQPPLSLAWRFLTARRSASPFERTLSTLSMPPFGEVEWSLDNGSPRSRWIMVDVPYERRSA
jgi:hypothetical protein